MKLGRIHDRSIDRVNHLDKRDQRIPEFAHTGKINAIDRHLYDIADRSFYRISRPINPDSVSHSQAIASVKDRSAQAIRDRIAQEWRSDLSGLPEYDRGYAQSVKRVGEKFQGAIAVASHHGSHSLECLAIAQRTAIGKESPSNRRSPLSRYVRHRGGSLSRARADERTRRSVEHSDRSAELLHALRCELEQLQELSARSNRDRKRYRSQIHAIERRITEIG